MLVTNVEQVETWASKLAKAWGSHSVGLLCIVIQVCNFKERFCANSFPLQGQKGKKDLRDTQCILPSCLSNWEHSLKLDSAICLLSYSNSLLLISCLRQRKGEAIQALFFIQMSSISMHTKRPVSQPVQNRSLYNPQPAVIATSLNWNI